jgi:hypothetical protein
LTFIPRPRAGQRPGPLRGGRLDLVYAGDIGGTGRRASLTAEAIEPLACQTLALRAVYGHPRYVFPPRDELLEGASGFIERTLREGRTPVMVAAALGEAQELVHFLGGRRTLRLHATAFRASQVYVAQGVPLKGFVPFEDEGEVVVVLPPCGSARAGSHRVCVFRSRRGRTRRGRGAAALRSRRFRELCGLCARPEQARAAIDGHAEDLARAPPGAGVGPAIREHQHQLRLPGM